MKKTSRADGGRDLNGGVSVDGWVDVGVGDTYAKPIDINYIHILCKQTHVNDRRSIRGAVVARWVAGQQVERSILYQGHVSSQIHLISSGCPRSIIALQ